MLRKVLTTVVILFVILGFFVFRSGESREVTAISSGSTQPAYVAAEGRISVRPDRRALLSAEVAGRIENITVDNLTPVKKGQLMAIIYNADLDKRIAANEEAYRKAQANYLELANGSRSEDIDEAAANLRRAESDLELAESNERRDKQLLAEGVIANSQYDATIAALKRAKSEVEAMREKQNKLKQGERREVISAAFAEMESQRLGKEALKASYEKTLIRSPLNGIVIRRYKNVSEFADVGDPVLEVADLSELIVEADVNEMDAGKVHSGSRAIVTSDAFPGQKFAAELYEVSAALKNRDSEPEDPATLIDQKILPVKARFRQPVPLKLGMKIDLKIIL